MSEPVTIEIMGEQFTIQCSQEQKANLIKAASLVHETMKKIDHPTLVKNNEDDRSHDPSQKQ